MGFEGSANIKDSGSMREFSTGAHRDNATGKGRCDLLPLFEVALVMEDKVIFNIAKFVKEKDIIYLVNALNIACKTIPQFDGNLANMMLETSHLYEDGANKYGANNWANGMPISVYLDSGIRHYLKTLRGDDDEPHYRGFVWNILNAMWTFENVPNAKDELDNFLINKRFD